MKPHLKSVAILVVSGGAILGLTGFVEDIAELSRLRGRFDEAIARNAVQMLTEDGNFPSTPSVRGVLGRSTPVHQASRAPVRMSRRRPQPARRSRPRTQGGRRRPLALDGPCAPRRPGRSRRSRGHAGPAQAERRHRREGFLRRGAAPVRGHPVRAVPLDGRQQSRSRRRAPARRLGQPRSGRRRDRGTLARPDAAHDALASPTPRSAPCCAAGEPAVRRGWSSTEGVPARRQVGRHAHTPALLPRRRQPPHLDRGARTHWNAFVSNLEMHGQGTFYDPRLDDAARFSDRRAERFGHVRNTRT